MRLFDALIENDDVFHINMIKKGIIHFNEFKEFPGATGITERLKFVGVRVALRLTEGELAFLSCFVCSEMFSISV